MGYNKVFAATVKAKLSHSEVPYMVGRYFSYLFISYLTSLHNKATL